MTDRRAITHKPDPDTVALVAAMQFTRDDDPQGRARLQVAIVGAIQAHLAGAPAPAAPDGWDELAAQLRGGTQGADGWHDLSARLEISGGALRRLDELLVRRAQGCSCSLRTRLVGDGCEVCKPALAAQAPDAARLAAQASAELRQMDECDPGRYEVIARRDAYLACVPAAARPTSASQGAASDDADRALVPRVPTEEMIDCALRFLPRVPRVCMAVAIEDAIASGAVSPTSAGKGAPDA